MFREKFPTGDDDAIENFKAVVGEGAHLGWKRYLGALALWSGSVLAAGQVRADDAPAPAAPPPALTFTVLEVVDLWRNTEGGVSVGGETESKLRVSATFDGSAIGDPGFEAHVQLFSTNGQSLSLARVGDLQTVSNIDAPTSVRLFDLWAQHSVGRALTLRAGLMDLNLDFDNLWPAALFINSSHGIGPDISRSGRTGPSIFPASSLGLEAIWLARRGLTLKAAVFDGVPGDPDHPGAFLAVKLSARDGAMMIGQADLDLGGGAQASLGFWGYTAHFSQIDPVHPPGHGQGGVYGSIEGPLPLGKDWSGWLRGGFADPGADVVANYFGAGLTKNGLLPGREADQAGLSVARAGIGDPARRAFGLPDAETTVEATYRFVAGPHLSLQPDLQYVIRPAAAPHLRNALVIGLRVILLGQHPSGTTDAED